METGNTSFVGDSNGLITQGSSSFNIFRKVTDEFIFPILICFSVLLSILTILVLRRSSLKSSSSVYIIGLTSVNLGRLTMLIIFIPQKYESISTIVLWGNIYSYLLAYVFWLGYVLKSLESWITLVYAIERLIAIASPLKAHVLSSEKRAKKFVFGIVLLSIISNVPQCFRRTVEIRTDQLSNETLHVFKYTYFGADPTNTQVIYWVYNTTAIFIPLSVLTVVNVVIIWKLRVAKSARSNLEEGAGSKRSMTKQAQIERIIVANLCCFLITNILPASAVITVAIYGPSVFHKFILEFNVRLILNSIITACHPIITFLLYIYVSESMMDSLKKVLGIR